MYRKGLCYIPMPYRRVVDALLKELLRRLQSRLISLVVYGSVARGDARNDSDLDVLVVIEGLPRSRLQRSYMFGEVEDSIKEVLEELWDRGCFIAISPVLKTPEEARKISPLYLDMVEDAVIVYDRGGFFQSVLERLRRRLKELGAERVWIGKKWYWRLKKDFKFGEVVSIE